MFSMPQKRPLTTKSDSKTSVLSLNRVQMFSMPQKRPLTTKSDSKTSVLSFQIESKCFLCLKKGPLRQNPTPKHRFYHFKSSPNVFYASKKAPYDKIRLQNIGFIIKSSPNVFYASKKAPYDKIRLQNIGFIISNRVQMCSMPQKRPLTTKSDSKTSVLSFQIESKCFLCLKKGPLRQNPTPKHRFYHFKSSPNVFYASKKAPYDKIRLQNIGFIISYRVQMFSMPQKRPLTTKSDSKTSVLSLNQVQIIYIHQKRPLTTKSDSKTSVLSFQIESKCFLCLKKGPLRQNPTPKHRFYHHKSSPNVFYASKKAPYDKIRLQKIGFIITNRVQMFSMPQKRPLTTKSDSKTSVLSSQIESKCFLCLKKGPLRQNPTPKNRFYHYKSSPNVFYASKKAPYDKIRLQNIGFIITNRVQMFSMPQKRPLTTKSDSKTSVLSLNRVQIFSIPQKRPLTTKSDFKTSVLSFQIESKCFLCLKKGPLRQNPTPKHRFYH